MVALLTLIVAGELHTTLVQLATGNPYIDYYVIQVQRFILPCHVIHFHHVYSQDINKAAADVIITQGVYKQQHKLSTQWSQALVQNYDIA